MTEALSNVLQMTAAAASVILMGVCGVCLCARLTRVMRGQENASGLTKEPFQIPLPFREMALAAAAAVLSRLALYALAYGFYRAGGGTQSFAGSFEALWTHWDVRHYLGIAKDGYTSVGDERLRLVFFPLYPAVTRVFSVFTGGRLFMAGTLVSLLASGVCAALLYDLANMHLGRRGARLAVAYFLLNPMSVFLACAYTEALFIALTLAAVCLLRRGHPWGAALCGMASALTRMPGVIVSGLFIIAFLARIPKEGIRVKAALQCLAQVGLVFCGLFIYWFINWAVTDDALCMLAGLTNIPLGRFVVIMALSRPWGLIVAALMGSGSISLPIWAWAVIGVAGLFIFYFAMKYSAQIEEALLRFVRKIVPQKTKIDRK